MNRSQLLLLATRFNATATRPSSQSVDHFKPGVCAGLVAWWIRKNILAAKNPARNKQFWDARYHKDEITSVVSDDTFEAEGANKAILLQKQFVADREAMKIYVMNGFRVDKLALNSEKHSKFVTKLNNSNGPIATCRGPISGNVQSYRLPGANRHEVGPAPIGLEMSLSLNTSRNCILYLSTYPATGGGHAVGLSRLSSVVRYYDPNMGEAEFASFDDFMKWFSFCFTRTDKRDPRNPFSHVEGSFDYYVFVPTD